MVDRLELDKKYPELGKLIFERGLEEELFSANFEFEKVGFFDRLFTDKKIIEARKACLKRFKDWFDVDPGAIIGRHRREVIGEEVFQGMIGFIEQTLQGVPTSFEIKLPKTKGGISYAQYKSVPHFNDHGAVDSYFVVCLDITGIKHAEKALRESQTNLNLALKGADLGTWNWDILTDRVQFNRRWAEMKG